MWTPERFIEVLGAELLVFEIVGENSGPSYSDADMVASGTAAVAVGAARVAPTLHAALGVATVDLSARAIRLAGLLSSGVASVALGAARVVPGSITVAGVGAVSMPSQALANATVSAAGLATLFTPTQALKDVEAHGAGSSSVFAPTQVLAYGTIAFEGWAQALLGSVTVLPAEVLAEAFAGTTLGALGLVARIDDLDMERPMEGRAMDRGPGDIAINVTPDEGLERPFENRSMEVTS